MWTWQTSKGAWIGVAMFDEILLVGNFVKPNLD